MKSVRQPVAEKNAQKPLKPDPESAHGRCFGMKNVRRTEGSRSPSSAEVSYRNLNNLRRRDSICTLFSAKA